MEEPGSSVGSHRSALLRGEYSISAAVELALEQVATCQHLTIMRHVREREARAEAGYLDGLVHRRGAAAWIDRPLLGVPITVKELTAVAGAPYTRGLDGEHLAADHDAPAVWRLRAAGCVILGTTCCPADGWCGASLNGSRPPTRNPWNPKLTAGGSSGGAAAAVSSGIGIAAIGTDGAGSVRIPASFCGVVGYKPTFGLVPYAPLSSEGLSHLGSLARSVEDAAVLVEVMSGPDSADPVSLTQPEYSPFREHISGAPVRIAWAPTLGGTSPLPEIVTVCLDALDQLIAAGHSVEQIDAPTTDPYPALATILATAEARATLVDEPDVAVHPMRQAIQEWGQTLTAADLASAIDTKLQVTNAYNRLLQDFDVVVTPTVPLLPFSAAAAAPPAFVTDPRDWLRWTPNTYLFNLTGQPAVSVPVRLSSEGLPIGMQVAAARYRDGRALSIANALHNSDLSAESAKTSRRRGGPSVGFR